ncbi:ribokinase isoform X2 [Cephus cinctus]|uniref:Ribokinase n=1 Tax=Cephus cinctus TaxID=211228 RepID=A0AAJ7VZ67_CEPCN|nr:ribokinase isoform X2 [Cephus cinctus]
MRQLINYSPRLPKPGETLAGSKFEQNYGGKGANQCVSATKLGASTAMVAALGSDVFGNEYLQRLKLEDVNVSHVTLKKNIHSGIAQITVANNGENTIVIVPGANTLLSTEDVDAAADIIRNAPVLLCQFEIPLETTLHALKLHQNHGLSILNGAPALANPNPELLKACDIFCVNETETEIMTGIQPLSLSNAQEAIDILLSQGCNTVILTLGALGALLASKESTKFIHIVTEQVDPVDTTGAGDAFLGAFAYFRAYHSHLSLEESIRRACQVATVSVLKTGTQTSFPTKKNLPASLFS